jgi:hypothetical protein
VSSKSNPTRSRQQATLKLEGQKLFKIDDGGGILSDLGGLPVAAKLAEQTGFISMAADALAEWRNTDMIDYELEELLAQRLFLCMSGHPDAIDCTLRKDDPALKSALGKEPNGKSLASQSTHTRKEKNITADTIQKLEAVPLQFFFSQHRHAPQNLSIYFDGSGIRTYGAQQNSTFRGGKKYNQTQYFPLIATTKSGWLLLSQLREGGASDANAMPAIQNLVLDIKARWKHTKITLTMDTGFNDPLLLDFLESEQIGYQCGYPTTSSVLSNIPKVLKEVEEEFRSLHGEPKYAGNKKEADNKWQEDHKRIRALPADKRMEAEKAQAARHVRKVVEFMHNGVNWTKDRRLVVRVDYTDRGLDIRSVVTNAKTGEPESLYENEYCKRARIEMFIKENKSHCRVPLSCQEFTANQFRFILQGFAYQMLYLMRLKLPKDRQNISVATVRKTLLQVPVLIVSTERRLYWHLSSVHPCTAKIIKLAQKLNRKTA